MLLHAAGKQLACGSLGMAEIETFSIIDLHPTPADMAAVVLRGLEQRPRQLPAWLLYDQQGSLLFEEICKQPEYTLKRTELELLQKHANSFCAQIPANSLVLEFGAGSAEKVGPLLQALSNPAYIALDISARHLQEAGKRLQAKFASVPMQGICADYSRALELPLSAEWSQRLRLGFFPGSSLGNFEPAEASAFLMRLKQLLGPNGALLIGIDQPRPKAQLEAAYNDAAGFSAAFARNLLLRLQRDLNAEVDPWGFSYKAEWQSEQQRIAMALVSNGEQRLQLLGQEVIFKPGEILITEYSYKYSPKAFQSLAASAGWSSQQRHCDAADSYSLHLLV